MVSGAASRGAEAVDRRAVLAKALDRRVVLAKALDRRVVLAKAPGFEGGIGGEASPSKPKFVGENHGGPSAAVEERDEEAKAGEGSHREGSGRVLDRLQNRRCQRGAHVGIVDLSPLEGDISICTEVCLPSLPLVPRFHLEANVPAAVGVRVRVFTFFGRCRCGRGVSHDEFRVLGRMLTKEEADVVVEVVVAGQATQAPGVFI